MKMDSTTSNTKFNKTEKVQVVLFVGSNPSNASTMDVAFHGSTKSSKILSQWISNIKDKLPVYINVMSKKTENNRPLKKSEINSNLDQLSKMLDTIKPDYVVALGKTASTALTLLRVTHYDMPHPSGRNRKLNNKQYVAEKIKGLVEFCSTKPI